MKQNVIIIENKGIESRSEELYITGQNIGNMIYAKEKNKELKSKIISTYRRNIDLKKSDLVLGFVFEEEICVSIEFSVSFVPQSGATVTFIGNVKEYDQLYKSINKIFSEKKINGFAIRVMTCDTEYIIIDYMDMVLILYMILNYSKYTGNKISNNLHKISCHTNTGIDEYFVNGEINLQMEYLTAIENITNTKANTKLNIKENQKIPQTQGLLNLASIIDIYEDRITLIFKCEDSRISYDNKILRFFDDIIVDDKKIYLKVGKSDAKTM